jgi:uroporphyrinogen-III synthase
VTDAAARPLFGYTIGITGHRRWEEQAEMLARRGAHIVHGPVISTTLLGDLDATVAATRRALAEPIDIVVLSTGIGIRSWFAGAESVGLDAELRSKLGAARVIARGPKAVHAARAEGLEVAWAAPGETNREIVETLAADGLAGRRVVVQRDGGEPVVAAEIAALGARDVVDIPVYRWDLPTEASPALRLLDQVVSSQLDAVTFTSATAVNNAFEIALDPTALADSFNRAVVVASVGPVTSQRLRDHGVTRLVEPPRARMGSMVLALSRDLERRTRTLRFGIHTMTWQGVALCDPEGTVVELTRGEERLLRTLVTRSPAVASKAQLCDPNTDEHAVETAIGRLRAKLGPLGAGIRTIRRRGYVCELGVLGGVAS